jgi:O-antigen/teichoic acid export membrane protein
MMRGTDFERDLHSEDKPRFWKSVSSPFLRRDLSVVLGGVFLKGFAALVFAKLTASLLGPAGYATYGHFYMVAAYLVTGSSLGLGNAFTVFIARRESAGADQFKQVRAVIAAGTACGFVVAGPLMGLFFADRHGALLPKIRGGDLGWWFAFCLVAATGTAIQSALLGKQEQIRYQLVTALNPIVSCVALGIFAGFGEVNPKIAIITYMIGFLVPIAMYPSARAGWGKIDWSAMKNLAGFSVPYLIPSLMSPTVGTIATLSVRHVVALNTSVHDLGLWQALWRLSEGYMGVLMAVGTAMFIPRFSRIRTRREAWTGLSRAATILVGIYLPLAASFLLIPRIVLSALLSSQFSGISAYLPTEIVGDILKILCFLLETFFACIVFPRLALLAEVLFAGLFLILTALMVSLERSPEGAVLAYSISYFLVALALLPIAWHRIRALPER